MIRSAVCPCCGTGDATRFQWALLSTFLSQRAFQTKPAPCRVFECDVCHHKWTERGLSDDEASRLYVGYRNDEYFEQRHRVEPWYSRAMNDGIGSEHEMGPRRALMSTLLTKSGVDERTLNTVVDWGGDRGQMLKDLPAREKFVHEVSNVEPDPGVTKAGSLGELKARADLVLNCHVLEHLNEPAKGLAESVSVLKPGGILYLELPYEPWRGPFVPPAVSKPWVELLARTKLPLLAADFVSTAARVKLHVLPPMGFVAVREHLNFFNVESVRRLVERGGLEVLTCVQPNATTLVAVGRLPA